MFVGYGDTSVPEEHMTCRSRNGQDSSGCETASKEGQRGYLGQLLERNGYRSHLLIPSPPDEDRGIKNSLSPKPKMAARYLQFKSLEGALYEEKIGLQSNTRRHHHVQLQDLLSGSPDQDDARILSPPQRRGAFENSYSTSNPLSDPNKRSKAHPKQRRRRVQESEGFQHETVLQKSNLHSLSLKNAILSPSRSPGIIFLSKKSPSVYPSPARSPVAKGCGFWIGASARKLCESRASRFSKKPQKICKFHANRHGIQSPVLKSAISCLLSHETDDNLCSRSRGEWSSSTPSCLGFLKVRKKDKRFLTCSSTSQQQGQAYRQNRENDCTDNDRISRSLWAYRGSAISFKLRDKFFGSSSRKVVTEAESDSSAMNSEAVPHKVTKFSSKKIFSRNGQRPLEVNRAQMIDRQESKHLKFQNASSNLAYVGSLFSLRKEISAEKRTVNEDRKGKSTCLPQSTLSSPNKGLKEGSNVSKVADLLPLHVDCIGDKTIATIVASPASFPQEKYGNQNPCFKLEMDSYREETPSYDFRLSSDIQCPDSACLVTDKIFSVDVCQDRAGKCEVLNRITLRMGGLEKESTTSNLASIEAIPDSKNEISQSCLVSDQGSEEDFGVACLFRQCEEHAPTPPGISHGCGQIISCITENHPSDNLTELEKIDNASCSPMSNKFAEDGKCSHFGSQGLTGNMAMHQYPGLGDRTEEQASSSPPNVKVVFEHVQRNENSVIATPMCVPDETQQQSPVSVLDAAFEQASATSVEEETDDDTPEQSCLANFQEAKRQLLEKLQVYERLATMDFSALQDYVNQNHDQDDDDSVTSDISVEGKESRPNTSYHVNPMWEDSDQEQELELDEEGGGGHVPPALPGPAKTTCTQNSIPTSSKAHSLNLARWETSTPPSLLKPTILKSAARPMESLNNVSEALTFPLDFLTMKRTLPLQVEEIGEELECHIFTSLTQDLALDLLSLSPSFT